MAWQHWGCNPEPTVFWACPTDFRQGEQEGAPFPVPTTGHCGIVGFGPWASGMSVWSPRNVAGAAEPLQVSSDFSYCPLHLPPGLTILVWVWFELSEVWCAFHTEVATTAVSLASASFAR